MNRKGDWLLVNCRAATMAAGQGYGEIVDAAVLLRGKDIAWVGKACDAVECDASRLDLGGRLVTPGLIDCHTHLVFGGNRSNEFEERLEGASYSDIARAGGGILSTVRATRAATQDELTEAALPRLKSLLRSGATTIEVKSGYGLDLDNELKMLRAAKALERHAAVSIVTTFLGLHALPPEYKGRADDYVKLVIQEILPAVTSENLAQAVDAYVEPIAFSPKQAAAFYEAASALGLRVKLHADQLSDSNGASLAASHGALSADHLEYGNDTGVRALAREGVTAVLLPGAYVTLREKKRPPIDALRRERVAMAVATDMNPGTSPMGSLLLAMNFACTMFGLTPAEALRGTTVNAAKALGLESRLGTIEAGKAADLAVWDAGHPSELSYWMGHSALHSRWVAGQLAV